MLCDEIQNCTVKDQPFRSIFRTRTNQPLKFQTVGSPVSQKGRTSDLLSDPVVRDEHLSASRKAVNKQSSLFSKIFDAVRLITSQGEQSARSGSAVSRDEQHSVPGGTVNTTSSTFLKIFALSATASPASGRR